MKKTNKGITLIALVITIIVLIILAGVSIAMLSGDNGIIAKATKAKTASEEATDKEQISLAYQKATMDEVMGAATTEFKDNFEDELQTYDESAIVVENGTKYKVTINGRIYEVDKEINITKVDETTQTAIDSTTKVGCYFDYDGDSTNGVDGIIYADLLNPITSEDYSYSQLEGTAKGYYISGKHKEAWDSEYKDVITTIASDKSDTSKKERFYVMELSDFTTDSYTKFYWYKSAYGHMSDCTTYTSNNFGAGKENTRKMIARWNLGTGTGIIDNITYEGYGSKNNQDIWGNITSKVNDSWFVPSGKEWYAFVGNLGVSKKSTDDKYYGKFGLNDHYWSSAQARNTEQAICMKLEYGWNFADDVTNVYYIRLSATF